MRVLVCGGRDFNDADLLMSTLDDLDDVKTISVIIHGGARGADQLADRWAHSKYVEVEEYAADWDAHKKAAGPIRNRQMLVEGKPDLVVAFPGGSGTANMISQAQKAGVKVDIIVAP